MANQLFLVMPTYEGSLENGYSFLGNSIAKLSKNCQEMFGVFAKETQAHDYAKRMSSLNGGRSFTIFCPTDVYYATESPVKRKTWKNGELVPA